MCHQHIESLQLNLTHWSQTIGKATSQKQEHPHTWLVIQFILVTLMPQMFVFLTKLNIILVCFWSHFGVSLVALWCHFGGCLVSLYESDTKVTLRVCHFCVTFRKCHQTATKVTLRINQKNQEKQLFLLFLWVSFWKYMNPKLHNSKLRPSPEPS